MFKEEMIEKLFRFIVEQSLQTYCIGTLIDKTFPNFTNNLAKLIIQGTKVLIWLTVEPQISNCNYENF